MPGSARSRCRLIAVAVYSRLPEPVAADPLAELDDDQFLNEWLADRAYYRISLTTDRPAVGSDNPDQRIAEDLRDFTDNTLSLGLGLMSNIVSLASFIGILWSLSGAVHVFGITIPGYMVWVALVYAVLGTWPPIWSAARWSG